MDIVIDISTSPRPSTLAELRRAHPMVSLPDDHKACHRRVLERYDAAPLKIEARPATTVRQVAELADPVQDADGWVMRWAVRDKTPEEIEREVDEEASRLIEISPADRAIAHATVDLIMEATAGAFTGSTHEAVRRRYRDLIKAHVRRQMYETTAPAGG